MKDARLSPKVLWGVLALIAALVALVFTIMTRSPAIEKTQFLRIGVEENYRPFTYVENGELVGFDPDISRAICRQLDIQCEIVPMHFDALIPALLDGKIDLITAGLGINEERRKTMCFSDIYYRSRSLFISTQQYALGINENTAEHLVIGAQRASLQAEVVRSRFVPKGAVLKEYEDYEELAEALRAGVVEAIFVDGLSGYQLLKQAEGSGLYIGGIAEGLTSDIVNAHIAARKNDEALIGNINKAMEQLKASGIYQTISLRYFAFMNY